VLLRLSSSCCSADDSTSRRVDAIDEPKVVITPFDGPERALIYRQFISFTNVYTVMLTRSIIACRRSSTDPGRNTLRLSLVSSSTKGSAKPPAVGFFKDTGVVVVEECIAMAEKRFAEGRAVDAGRCGRGSRGIGGMEVRVEDPDVEGVSRAS
jgi:hypothetical protein